MYDLDLPVSKKSSFSGLYQCDDERSGIMTPRYLLTTQEFQIYCNQGEWLCGKKCN